MRKQMSEITITPELTKELRNSETIDLSGNTIYWETLDTFSSSEPTEREPFARSRVIKEIDLSNSIINIESGWLLEEVFCNCTNLERVNITNCRILADSPSLALNSLFRDCKNLKEIIGLDTFLHINDNINQLRNMFRHCKSLQSINLGEDYTFKDDVDYSGMFAGCSNLKELTLGNIGITVDTERLSNMLYQTNPSVKINHTGRFNVGNRAIRNYCKIASENTMNTSNPFSYLFVRRGNTKVIIHTIEQELDLRLNELWSNSKITEVTYKNLEEIEKLRAKHEILGVKYFDLMEAYVYIVGDLEEIVIMQEETDGNT